VSPFNYTALVWGSLLGFAVWGDLPTVPMIAGATIVTLAGLYLLRHETLRRGPPRSAPAPVRPAQ
jgi:drug/metabolite transporter (DMT)-like permease